MKAYGVAKPRHIERSEEQLSYGGVASALELHAAHLVPMNRESS